MNAVARDRRPPAAMVRILNPIMRSVLRTPVGRMIRPLALLDFMGRRSGRRYLIPVGWHDNGGAPVVLTPAPWRANFDGGLAVVVRHGGRARPMIGTLVTDPNEVAAVIRSLIEAGELPRSMGIDMPSGHRFTAEDVIAVNRALLRFTAA